MRRLLLVVLIIVVIIIIIIRRQPRRLSTVAGPRDPKRAGCPPALFLSHAIKYPWHFSNRSLNTSHSTMRKRENFFLSRFCLSTDDLPFTTTYLCVVVRKLVFP